jgi:hypothetical protein
LGRASSAVKESFSKIESPKESDEAAGLLKTLLEGVEMTEKQLAEVDCSTLCSSSLVLGSKLIYGHSFSYLCD